MRIYPPVPKYTDSEKRLIELLARHLLECLEPHVKYSNRPSNHVVLTDNEADELLGNIERIADSKQFYEICHFVEGLTAARSDTDGRLREIYLANRRKRGRTRVAASFHWNDFNERLQSMSFEYFLAMERKLLGACDLNPILIDIVIQMLESTRVKSDEARSRTSAIKSGTIKKKFLDPIRRLCKNSESGPVPRHKIVGAITILADSSVLFTSRDWGVAGTISTISACFIDLTS